MKKKSKAGAAIALALGLGLLVWGGTAMAAGDETKPKIPQKPYMPGPGGKGKVFTGGGSGGKLPEDLPAAFDYAGNGLYIDTNCEYVIEGNQFFPTGSANAYEAPTLAETLALSDPPGLLPGTNSVIGYVDYLIDTLGYRQPEQIAWKILEEASPMCASVDPAQWGPGLVAWYESFLARVVEYVEEATGLAEDFDPSRADDDLELETVWEDEA